MTYKSKASSLDPNESCWSKPSHSPGRGRPLLRVPAMAWNDWPEVRSVRNRREGFRFALQPAAGRRALTGAVTRPHALAAAQLQNDHGYVVLGNSAHSLTHPRGIDRAEGGDQLDAAPM